MSDYRTTTGEPLPYGRRDRRKRQMMWARRVAGGVLVLTTVGLVIRVPVRIPATGYVTTDDYAEVRVPVAGRVAAIAVRSGDAVATGDLLVQLDDSIEQARHQEQLNAVRRDEARLLRREAELAQQERDRNHRLTQAELRLQHAAAALRTTEELHAQGLASGRTLDDQRLALTLAQSDFDNLKAVDRTLDEKELAALRLGLAVQHAASERTRIQLEARRITAPIDGEAVRYPFSAGELVTPDVVLYEIFGGERLVLKLRIPERHAVRVAPGAPYVARLRSYSGWGSRRFAGRVQHLRAVIQSDAYAPYRQALCPFDAGGLPVPPGTTAEARITIARLPFWLWLFRIR